MALALAWGAPRRSSEGHKKREIRDNRYLLARCALASNTVEVACQPLAPVLGGVPIFGGGRHAGAVGLVRTFDHSDQRLPVFDVAGVHVVQPGPESMVLLDQQHSV